MTSPAGGGPWRRPAGSSLRPEVHRGEPVAVAAPPGADTTPSSLCPAPVCCCEPTPPRPLAALLRAAPPCHTPRPAGPYNECVPPFTHEAVQSFAGLSL